MVFLKASCRQKIICTTQAVRNFYLHHWSNWQTGGGCSQGQVVETGAFISFNKHVRLEFLVAWDFLRAWWAKWIGREGIAQRQCRVITLFSWFHRYVLSTTNSSMAAMECFVSCTWSHWLCPCPSYKYMLFQIEESSVGEILKQERF